MQNINLDFCVIFRLFCLFLCDSSSYFIALRLLFVDFTIVSIKPLKGTSWHFQLNPPIHISCIKLMLYWSYKPIDIWHIVRNIQGCCQHTWISTSAVSQGPILIYIWSYPNRRKAFSATKYMHTARPQHIEDKIKKFVRVTSNSTGPSNWKIKVSRVTLDSPMFASKFSEWL